MAKCKDAIFRWIMRPLNSFLVHGVECRITEISQTDEEVSLKIRKLLYRTIIAPEKQFWRKKLKQGSFFD